MDTSKLDRIKALLRKQDTCVLATAFKDVPHCSLMSYATDDECREIYMVTFKDTTKHRNLCENPVVSLLVDTRKEIPGVHRSNIEALTVDGRFERIRDPAKQDQGRGRLLERHPHLKEFIENEDAEIFSVKVTSFLLLDGLTDAHFEAVDDEA